MVMCNTFFEHEHRKLYTWKSPGDIRRNQIDYIMIKHRYKNNVKNAKTYPGADINSDHNPVVIKLNLRLKKTTHCILKATTKETTALKQPEVQQKYLEEVKSKFESLMAENRVQQNTDKVEDKINDKWECLKNSIQTANLPPKEQNKNKSWMTREILSKMAERNKAKNTPQYEILDKEKRRMCRSAKEEWLETKFKKIEELSIQNKSKEMCNEISQIPNKRPNGNRNNCIKNNQGEILLDKTEILERWA
jgi:hypothetical protein